jgi:hypothetical protein
MSSQNKSRKPTIPVEWKADVPFAVPTEEFKYVDRPRDLILEALRAGKAIEPVIDELIEEREDAIRAETVNRLIEWILSADNPALAAWQAALAGGLTVILGKNGSDVAGMFGISKEAVQQGVDRFCKELGLRKTRAMRDDEAREEMSRSNYRPLRAKEDV